MTIEEEIKKNIGEAVLALFAYQLSSSEILIQPTRKEFQGTHTFVTFSLLKITKKTPEETGQLIGDYLISKTKLLKDYNVVKGFLNLILKDQVWILQLKQLMANPYFGQLPANDQNVMVEFSSPNTNKQLHLGHLRNNFLGDAISRILKASGCQVKKTNLVNDRGIHICKSMLAYQRFGNNETPVSANLKGDHLAGKYYVLFDQAYKQEVVALTSQGLTEDEAKKKAPMLLAAQEMLLRWEEKDPEIITLWNLMNKWVYDGFEVTYKTMGITFDTIYKESDTYLLGKDIIDEGLLKGVFFKKSDGSVWIDLTADGLDQKLVMRADGTSVYITQDIGTCDFKYGDFQMDQSVYVVGNEQDYHFKVLFSIMKKLGRPYSNGLYHLSYGMVDLPTGKMKSREGTVVDADELMNEMFQTAAQQTLALGKIEGLSKEEANNLYTILGLGALKYFLLNVDPKKRMLFDPKESIEFQGHTGPFIQYTHARIASILRRAQNDSPYMVLDRVAVIHDREINLIAQIIRFEQVILQAANEFSPAILAQYVYDVAKDYNGFYQELSIFNEPDQNRVQFLVALSKVTALVISRGMFLLGIDVPDRM